MEFSSISRGFSAFFSGFLLVLLLASPCAAQTDCDWRDGGQCEQPVLECDGSTCVDPAQQQPARAETTDSSSWWWYLIVLAGVFALGYVLGLQKPREIPRKNAAAILSRVDGVIADRVAEANAYGAPAAVVSALARAGAMVKDGIRPML